MQKSIKPVNLSKLWTSTQKKKQKNLQKINKIIDEINNDVDSNCEEYDFEKLKMRNNNFKKKIITYSVPYKKPTRKKYVKKN